MGEETFENDCIALLNYLSDNGYTSLEKIAGAVGLSRDDTRRYLVSDTWENRKGLGSYLLKVRGSPFGTWAISNGVVGADGHGKLNTSKHDYFRHYAYVYGYSLVPTNEYPGYGVVKITEEDLNVSAVMEVKQ